MLNKDGREGDSSEPSRTSQHVAVSKHMQDFDHFAKRRCTQKLDCGSLSRLQDPYKLWRMLQVYRKNDQVYRNSYGSCSLLKLPQSNFRVHLRLAKGSKSCICLLTATCWLVLDGYPILFVHFGAVTASLHIIEWS